MPNLVRPTALAHGFGMPASACKLRSGWCRSLPPLQTTHAWLAMAAGKAGIEVKAGKGGLPTVFLKSAAGATAEVGGAAGAAQQIADESGTRG